MVLIFAVASAAVAAIKAFNRLPAPARQQLVFAVTQGTSVLIAITTAIQWVMQGLMGLTRLSSVPSPPFGSTVQVGRPASERVAA